jgi:ParB/RepB/Spo0J family partition protein
MIYEKTKDIKTLQVSCSDKERHLPPERAAVEAMKKSLRENGQINPIGVYPITHNTYRLISGATRFRAASEMGWETIRASIWSGSAIEFELHELIENVDRRSLTNNQRREMREKIKALQHQMLADVIASKGGRGKKGGVADAARQAGVSDTTARRRQAEAKPHHNTKSGEVSDDAPPTKSIAPPKYGTKKHSIDWPMSLYRRLSAWCEQQNVVFSEGVRRICRERMDSEEQKSDNIIKMQAKA